MIHRRRNKVSNDIKKFCHVFEESFVIADLWLQLKQENKKQEFSQAQMALNMYIHKNMYDEAIKVIRKTLKDQLSLNIETCKHDSILNNFLFYFLNKEKSVSGKKLTEHLNILLMSGSDPSILDSSGYNSVEMLKNNIDFYNYTQEKIGRIIGMLQFSYYYRLEVTKNNVLFGGDIVFSLFGSLAVGKISNAYIGGSMSKLFSTSTFIVDNTFSYFIQKHSYPFSSFAIGVVLYKSGNIWGHNYFNPGWQARQSIEDNNNHLSLYGYDKEFSILDDYRGRIENLLEKEMDHIVESMTESDWYDLDIDNFDIFLEAGIINDVQGDYWYYWKFWCNVNARTIKTHLEQMMKLLQHSKSIELQYIANFGDFSTLFPVITVGPLLVKGKGTWDKVIEKSTKTVYSFVNTWLSFQDDSQCEYNYEEEDQGHSYGQYIMQEFNLDHEDL